MPRESDSPKGRWIAWLWAGVRVLLRLILGGLLISSALPKLQQPYDFLAAVYDYELVGPRIGLFVATLLPWLELVLGIALLAGLCSRGAWALSVMLLSVFTVARVSVLSRGMSIPCGCFGKERGEPIQVSDAVITGLMLLAATVGLFCSLRVRASSMKHQI
jgi:uncharacterized membrane protein YphA (DoxX/SURF4 family)